MTKEELIKLSRENLRKSRQGSLCECYDEAFIKGYELSEKRIEELEKENAELKKSCDETQELLDKQIEATYKLDKENAELKKENEELKEVIKHFNPCGEWNDDVHDCEFRHYAIEYGSKLAKAKEIVKQFNQVLKEHKLYHNELYKQAEQFLKE